MSDQILTVFEEMVREILRTVMEVEQKAILSGDTDLFRKCAALRTALTLEVR